MTQRGFALAGLVLALSAGAGHAESFEQEVISKLHAQGYKDIIVSRTLLGRAQISATGAGEVREIILNPRTGEILRDLSQNVAETGSGAAKPSSAAMHDTIGTTEPVAAGEAPWGGDGMTAGVSAPLGPDASGALATGDLTPADDGTAPDPTPPDSAGSDGPPPDATTPDATTPDAATPDAATPDASPTDSPAESAFPPNAPEPKARAESKSQPDEADDAAQSTGDTSTESDGGALN